MQKEIYQNLYNNRTLKNYTEIEMYEYNLERLSETFSEEDIVELCLTFDDETQNVDVMFGAVHLLETLSSETAFVNTTKGVVKMYDTSPEWAEIIICRCLNDENAVSMIRQVKDKVDEDEWDTFKEILGNIRNEDEEKFGKIVDMIV